MDRPTFSREPQIITARFRIDALSGGRGGGGGGSVQGVQGDLRDIEAKSRGLSPFSGLALYRQRGRDKRATARVFVEDQGREGRGGGGAQAIGGALVRVLLDAGLLALDFL